MSEKKIFRFPIKWKKQKTQDGTLYTYASNELDTRTCLIKSDMTVEVRVNGEVSKYPSDDDIADLENVKDLLEKVQSARLCTGTKTEDYNCPNVLFPIEGRVNSLCIWCPHCRVLRRKDKEQEKRKTRKLYRSLAGVSELERKCVVKGCPGRDIAQIRCFPIPSYDIDAWCENLKLNVSDVTEDTRVCSRHFEEQCLNPRTLKGGSRPTIKLGHNDVVRHKNGRFMKPSRIHVCCIVGCNVSHPPHQVFRFPDEEERLKQWLLICVIKDDFLSHRNKYICRKHFDPSMIHNNSLKKNAVPKVDAISWLENNANTNVDVLKGSLAKRAPAEKNLLLEPEVQALSEIQDALITKMEVCKEDEVSEGSDVFDSLQCRNVCLTCARAFKDCETYRQGCYDLEKQLQELQARTDELKTQNEILMAELESNYVVYQEDQ